MARSLLLCVGMRLACLILIASQLTGCSYLTVRPVRPGFTECTRDQFAPVADMLIGIPALAVGAVLLTGSASGCERGDTLCEGVRTTVATSGVFFSLTGIVLATSFVYGIHHTERCEVVQREAVSESAR